MAEVKVLIEGYARGIDGDEFASSSTVLIKEKGLNIIVDPGMDRKRLLSALKKENLSMDDINYVVLTHMHADHCLLAGIFEKARVLDDSSIYSWDGKIEEHEGKIPGTDIKIIKTPGHDMFHCSILVNTKEFGKVAIAEDVFWWRDGAKQKLDRKSLLNLPDPYVKDKKALLASRKKILELSDYIIPGHGKMFEVKK